VGEEGESVVEMWVWESGGMTLAAKPAISQRCTAT
jgi:hypothetical protein